MATTQEMLARIEAQRAYFASDERIRDRAEPWRDATIEECLAATREACEAAMQLIEMQDDVARASSVQADPLPADTLEILERIQQLAKR